MAESSYNGWANYETWAVKLHLDNEQGTYYDVTGHATEMVTEAANAEMEADAYEFESWLKDYVEELLPELDGLACDLLRAALSEVNWQEIAEAYLEDAKAGLVHS